MRMETRVVACDSISCPKILIQTSIVRGRYLQIPYQTDYIALIESKNTLEIQNEKAFMKIVSNPTRKPIKNDATTRTRPN